MNEIQYVGENLLPGQLGHFTVVLSFVGSLMAAVAYFFATNNRQNESFDSWRNLGRLAFGVHELLMSLAKGSERLGISEPEELSGSGQELISTGFDLEKCSALKPTGPKL